MQSAEMDKDGLLKRMNASYERVETALDALTPEQWVAPRELGAWSARDVVAHLTAWLEKLSDELDAVMAGKPPQVSIVNLSDADVDAMNAQSTASRGDDTPQQTHGAFRRAFGRATDATLLLPEDDYTAVGRYEWLGDMPLWRLVAEETWEHFDEHLPEIEQARGVKKS